MGRGQDERMDELRAQTRERRTDMEEGVAQVRAERKELRAELKVDNQLTALTALVGQNWFGRNTHSPPNPTHSHKRQPHDSNGSETPPSLQTVETQSARAGTLSLTTRTNTGTSILKPTPCRC
ncbi:MAG: hypothetical protein TE42_10475 [Candidatus Synechococcus spongiarum SP3]|uniref:Uncharacterized protein n=1 Tax=Candidatus Synechococcus spongiarum SP3 TaxID=1604020 RepID=A0A0G2HIT2_9SYNE|nr:MAG: hypothetical protein TE42_10475 [Candidatus Synechococcus spongiarum SP3]